MASEITPATVTDRIDAHYAAARQATRLAARAAALEELADALGVALTDDRRRQLPPQRR